MSRNRALRLLALLASLFVILPLATVPAGIIVELTGPQGALVALVAAFFSWALLTLLLGNCLIAVWGTATPPPVPQAVQSRATVSGTAAAARRPWGHHGARAGTAAPRHGRHVMNDLDRILYATVGLALAAVVLLDPTFVANLARAIDAPSMPPHGLELWGSAVALLLCAAIVLYGRRRP